MIISRNKGSKLNILVSGNISTNANPLSGKRMGSDTQTSGQRWTCESNIIRVRNETDKDILFYLALS